MGLSMIGQVLSILGIDLQIRLEVGGRIYI